MLYQYFLMLPFVFSDPYACTDFHGSLEGIRHPAFGQESGSIRLQSLIGMAVPLLPFHQSEAPPRQRPLQP